MADLITSGVYPLLFASVGGILPALFWLWFWLQEDKLHPEPRGRILLAFWGGMVAVAIAFPFERYVYNYYGLGDKTLLLWAAIEEIAKFAVIYVIALRSRAYDEPIDAVEYLITGALGFAALENTLFILNPFLGGEYFQGFVTGNMRFIGASLLHVVSSGVLGYCIGREFYRPFKWKIIWRIYGLATAIALHTVFNKFIMYQNGERTFVVFACVWIATLGLLLLFEKIKKVTQ
jgi:RsiW-degrading membrane proteinase PrsW (M82 family)